MMEKELLDINKRIDGLEEEIEEMKRKIKDV